MFHRIYYPWTRTALIFVAFQGGESILYVIHASPTPTVRASGDCGLLAAAITWLTKQRFI